MASDGGNSPTRRGKRGVGLNSMHVENDDEIHASSGVEASERVLWERFESLAFAITKLYRNPSWPIFQQAAASTTEYYKDSVEAHRRGFDSGVVLGRQLLCKELLSWFQSSSHPYVRRDECINVLLGRTQSSATVAVQTLPPSSVLHRSSSVDCVVQPNGDHQRLNCNDSSSVSDELEIFQDALNSPPGLTAFFIEECRRHAKRRYNNDDDNNASGGDGWSKKRIRRA